jgi:hypothetical protein
MKRTWMVEFELPETLSPEFVSLIPQQRLAVDDLLAEGTIRSYALAIDRSTLWVVVEAETEFEVMEVISQMPLSDHMEPYISELFFHNTPDVVHAFSLN